MSRESLVLNSGGLRGLAPRASFYIFIDSFTFYYYTNKIVIFQSLKTQSFDHIYAIYNLLVDKLHQRTINFQSKLTKRAPCTTQKRTDLDISDQSKTEDKKKLDNTLSASQETEERGRINERSESFNDRLGEQNLATERRESFTEHISVGESAVRRESFNENYLRNTRHEVNERRSSFNESEAMGSPFVSMPTIPAVYLSGDTTQPLEKVRQILRQ